MRERKKISLTQLTNLDNNNVNYTNWFINNP